MQIALAKIQANDNNKTEALKLKLIVVAFILVVGAFGVCVPLLGLGDKAWGDFPLGNFVAMLAVVVVMMVETAATNWFNRSHYNKNGASHIGDEEKHEGHVHVDTHTSNGHAHVYMEDSGLSEGFLRHRIISQVLEVANFKIRTIATMSIFLPSQLQLGSLLGFGISNTYDENNHKALIVQGVLNAASAGILIYMAIVDLLVVDFMKVKVRISTKCQILAFISLLLGVGCLSLLAIWA
ncbi:hypothetical protein L2E82_11512 [Cichorium intybus]|uniref:Uncharacterized protein n=1 Tax=Cichorium intybus TaxID=13427 RepID=A0ACB9GEQ9_CICIN|nr:hypothetical protein L2E82_11512 [Cichorium intybus]